MKPVSDGLRISSSYALIGRVFVRLDAPAKPKAVPTRTCPTCGESFRCAQGGRVYCSAPCRPRRVPAEAPYTGSRHQRRYARLKTEGRCTKCGREAKPGRVYCVDCADRYAAWKGAAR